MNDGTRLVKEPPSRVAFRDVLAVGEFRALWLAELVSVAGDQLARVALSVIVFEDTRSAALTGLTYALTYAPSLIGGILLAGVSDSVPRRTVLIAVDLMRAVPVLLVAIPGLPFWTLCILVSSVSLLNPVYKAAQLALLAQILPDDRFAAGMAIRSMTVQSAQLVGFGGGGVVVVVVGAPTALLLDAATFLASALCVSVAVRRRPAATVSRHDVPRSGWFDGFRRGGAIAFVDRRVRTLMLLIWLMAFLTVYEGLAAPYAVALGGDSATVGLLLASDPFGGVVGTYLFARLVPAHLRPRLIGPLAVGAAAPLVLCLLGPGLPASVGLFVVSGGLGTVVVMQATTIFTVTVPDSGRGQALGLSNTGLTTASGLCPLLAGVVADQVGVVSTVGGFGLLCLVLALPLAASWARQPATTGGEKAGRSTT